MKQRSASRAAKRPRAPSTEIDDLPLPYVEIDAHGFITRANRAPLPCTIPSKASSIGKSGWDLMAADEKDLSSAAFLSRHGFGRRSPRHDPLHLRPLRLVPHLRVPSQPDARAGGKARGNAHGLRGRDRNGAEPSTKRAARNNGSKAPWRPWLKPSFLPIFSASFGP